MVSPGGWPNNVRAGVAPLALSPARFTDSEVQRRGQQPGVCGHSFCQRSRGSPHPVRTRCDDPVPLASDETGDALLSRLSPLRIVNLSRCRRPYPAPFGPVPRRARLWSNLRTLIAQTPRRDPAREPVPDWLAEWRDAYRRVHDMTIFYGPQPAA